LVPVSSFEIRTEPLPSVVTVFWPITESITHSASKARQLYYFNLISNMKIKTCLALLALCVIDSVMGQNTVTTDGSGSVLISNEETGTNPDGSINWQFYARAAGNLFVGAMSGT
jgi:hypothetical protein